MAPPADSTEGATPDAGLPAESAPAEIAAQPMPAEHDGACVAAPTVAAEAPIELAALETSSASEPVPTGLRRRASAPDERPRRPARRRSPTAPKTASGEPQRASTIGHNVTEVNGHGAEAEEEVVESVGGADAMEEVPERTPRLRRQYKIQEVIKRRQVMLVQVVKEERGTKGAALTTYLSLAGRYSVLMPNTARGGGISRKITSADDRTQLEGNRPGARSAGRHGRDPAHRRRRAAPRPRSSATSNICCGCGRRCAT